MPGILKVKVVEGRNLPVMDRSSDTTDAYVELKLGSISYKTDVCRKTLNPVWNSEWFKFEMDDVELQDDPLQVRLMDHDTYSANDPIGKLYFNLNPLMQNCFTGPALNDSTLPVISASSSASNGLKSGNCINGWFPVYDTMHGIRGELFLTIKLQLFSDLNKFRQSSCGIQFYSSSCIPYGHVTQAIYGLVEELVVDEDPEYQWIEKIRTPRASNEARQSTAYKMSGELQRIIGLKVIELGGNAVIGYRQYFDLEGESGGIVVRAVGTAVKLLPIAMSDETNSGEESARLSTRSALIPQPASFKADGKTQSRSNGEGDCSPTKCCKITEIPPTVFEEDASELDAVTNDHPAEENSDASDYRDGCKLASSQPWLDGKAGYNVLHRHHLDMMEYPFLTLSIYPDSFISRFGGTVSARSVKLLSRMGGSGSEAEPETRDAWWTELRVEIKCHMRALGCNVVLNYVEHTTICDEVCVLSASGTAAIARVASSCMDDEGPDRNGAVYSDNDEEDDCRADERPCSVFHIPYRKSSLPFPTNLKKCALCKTCYVPDMLFVTVEPMDSMPMIGDGAFVTAATHRMKRDCRSELNDAREISDGLPFLEYELNRLLVNKIRIKGMNAVFGLNVRVSVGEKVIAAYATGTAVLLACLPHPLEPSLAMSRPFVNPEARRKFEDTALLLRDSIIKNKAFYKLTEGNWKSKETEANPCKDASNMEENMTAIPPEDAYQELDLFAGSKPTCIIEVDDEGDMDMINQLLDAYPPQGFFVSGTEKMASECPPVFRSVSNCRFLAQVSRHPVSQLTTPGALNKLFYRTLQGLYISVHNRIPCCISKISYKLEIPETEELQICIVGMATELDEMETNSPRKLFSTQSLNQKTGTSCETSGKLDDSSSARESITFAATTPRKSSRKKLRHNQSFPTQHLSGSKGGTPNDCAPWSKVKLSSLTYVPGATSITSYLGNLNFIFIKEGNGVRDQSGGVNHFAEVFLEEVESMVKAHAMGIGGNAVVGFFLNECMLTAHPHKNQGQSLINVGGDVVLCTF